MNMQYVKGQIVGYVPVGADAPAPAVPVERPQRWYVLKTFAGKEAKVMRTFERRGISAYCPLERREVTREQRRFGVVVRRLKVTIKRPLFDGVLFIPDFQAKLGGVRVDGVEGYLRMGDCYPYLTSEGYDRIKQIEAFKSMPVAHYRRLLKQGDALRVTSGPVAGLCATFDRLDSEGRLKVLVSLFGRLTSVVLDEDQIEPA